MRTKKGDGEKNDTDMIATKGRLQEMKVILEKIRPMNQKLAYQTKKLLSLADTITAVERSNKDDNDKEEEIDYVHNILKQQENLSSFGPNPEALMDSEDDEDAEDDPTPEAEEDDPEDEDLMAAKAATAFKTSEHATNDNLEVSTDRKKVPSDALIYRAPRLTSVEYLEKREKKQQERERIEEKRRQKMRKSELLQTLRSSFGETPEEEDIDGGARVGSNSTSRARELADKEAERIAYEEDAMVRLTITRKEKKERNRILHEEKSNLRALSDLGNLTTGISAFIESSSNFNDEDPLNEGSELLEDNYKQKRRHANGRRKRSNSFGDGGEDVVNGGLRKLNRGKGRRDNYGMVKRFSGNKRKNQR